MKKKLELLKYKDHMYYTQINKKTDREHQKCFQRRKQLIAGFACTLSLSCSLYLLNMSLYDPFGRIVTLVPTSLSMEELIQKQVSENSYLSENEKSFFTHYNSYLNDNPYCDLKDVCYNLKHVSIHDKSEEPKQYVAGKFEASKVKITLYDPESRTDDFNEMILGHEGFHMIDSSYRTIGFIRNGSKLGRGLTEGMTQILTEEYIKEKAFGVTETYVAESLLVKYLN